MPIRDVLLIAGLLLTILGPTGAFVVQLRMSKNPHSKKMITAFLILRNAGLFVAFLMVTGPTYLYDIWVDFRELRLLVVAATFAVVVSSIAWVIQQFRQ